MYFISKFNHLGKAWYMPDDVFATFETPTITMKTFFFLLILGLQFFAFGVPIHGVGLQGHWSLNSPSEVNLRAAIEKFSSLGLKIQITELDISVYTSGREAAVPVLTPDKEQKQIVFSFYQ